MTKSLRLWHYLTRYIDGVLLSGILLLMLTGLFTLYSATDANPNRVTNQAVNMLVALSIMWLVANIPLQHIMRIALPIYMTGLLLLVGVALFGEINNGARRWLNIGVTRIQPFPKLQCFWAICLSQSFYERPGLSGKGFALGERGRRAQQVAVTACHNQRQPQLLDQLSG